MSFNWTQVPVRLLRRNAYDVAMKEYERQVTEEVSAKNRQAQIAAVAPNRGWMHHISSENNKADSYRIAWEVTMQKLQQQERQREWDAQAAQNQYWAKTQEKAQSSLAKTGEMLNLDPLARQRRIAEETYRLASQDAQSKGDFETAQEYERRMRLAMGDKTSAIEQATPEDLSSGLVKRTVEQGPAQPQGALSRYAQYAEEKDPQRVASMKALGQKASAFKDELLSPETRQEAVAGWKQSKRGEFMFSAGVGGIMQSLGGALEAYGKNGQWLVDAGTRIQAEATRGLPEAKNKGEQMSDAIWSSAPFLVGAMGLAAGGMQAAAAMGLGTVGTWLIGSLLGTAASRPFESVTEAGQAYLEAKNRGASQEVAKEAYDSVFKGNMRLAGWDAVQIAVAFAPMPAKILGKAASPLLKTLRIGSKVAIVGLTEGGEEVYQDMIQKKAQGDPFYWNPEKWDEDTKLAFAVGTIMGVGFGAGGDVLTVGPKVRAIAPETFDMAHDSAIAEGKAEDVATAEAIIEVAKEQPQAVEAIIPQQAAVQQERAPSVEKQGTEGIVSQEGTTVTEQSTEQVSQGKQPWEMEVADLDYTRNRDAAYANSKLVNGLLAGKGPQVGEKFTWRDGNVEAEITNVRSFPDSTNQYSNRTDVFDVKIAPQRAALPGTKGGAGREIKGLSLSDMARWGYPLARLTPQQPVSPKRTTVPEKSTGVAESATTETEQAPTTQEAGKKVAELKNGTIIGVYQKSSSPLEVRVAKNPSGRFRVEARYQRADGTKGEWESLATGAYPTAQEAVDRYIAGEKSESDFTDLHPAAQQAFAKREQARVAAEAKESERRAKEQSEQKVRSDYRAALAAIPLKGKRGTFTFTGTDNEQHSFPATFYGDYAIYKIEPVSKYSTEPAYHVAAQTHKYEIAKARSLQDAQDVIRGLLHSGVNLALADVSAITPAQRTIGKQVVKYAAYDGKVPDYFTQQSPTPPDTSGQIIGGVEAYDPMRGIFEYDPTESIKRLFPESNIGKVTQAMGNLPFGEEAVGFFNPTLTPRESLAAQTVQEHGAVANDLVYRVASGRKAYIGNLAKSLFPEGDAVKHFKVDDQGIQHAFSAKVDGAPMGIVDVLENPQNYELDAPAQEFVKLWRKVHKQAITELEKRGIKVNQKFYEEGGGYFPRMVRSAYGEDVSVPRVKYRKPRSFASQEEGIYNEIGYTIDPIHNINGFIDETFRIIAAHDLKQVVDSVGRTAKDSVPVSLRIARDEAVKRHKIMLRAYSAAQRVKRGEKLPSATIRSIEGIDEAAARLVEGKDTKALKAMVDESRRLATRARKDYSVALDRARGPRLGSFERGTIHPAFKGQWFSEETAKVLDALAPKAASDAWRKVQSVNEAMRTVKANFDFSPGTIQGLNVLARRPDKWGQVTTKAFEWLLKPENAPKWFAKHGDIISRHPDIVQGTHEYYAGQEIIKTKLGKPGKALAKAMTPFEEYFTNWGDAARVLMAEALEPSFVKAGTPERLGTYINRMTGVMDTRALGVSGRQRAFESLMLFAPRYTRASIAYIGTAMEGGVMGAEARKTIALLIGAGTLFWMGMQKAMGEEPAWPNSPNFWTVKMGNRRVGMGGFMYSFIRLLADSYQSIASEGGNEPADFKAWDRTNPIINFLSKRTSVLWRAALTVRDETDFMGYPIEGFDEWAHYFMVEMMAPISIQEQLTGANEDAPSNRLGVAAAELFGLRTFPENEYYALADKYAQAAYGKDWNELSKPTKAGSYSQSPEQKRLMEMHPDLKAAYDAQKDRASERWKAQHDLLGDKNISRDAWAREMFGKDYKDLPKEYQKQVDEAIARG